MTATVRDGSGLAVSIPRHTVTALRKALRRYSRTAILPGDWPA